MTTVTRLSELGMVPRVATEVLAQFASTTGNAGRLQELGVPGGLAFQIAAQAAGTKDVRRLIEAGMAPDLALEVVS